MNKKEIQKDKVYFGLDPNLHKEFIKYIETNDLNKSKVIERLIKEYMKPKLESKIKK